MNKYAVTGVIGLLVVLGVGYFLMNQEKIELAGPVANLVADEGSADLFELIPDGIDQLMYMDVDPGLITVMKQVDSAQASTVGFDEAMEQVDQLAAVQYSDDQGIYSILFIEADDIIALEKIQEIGLVVGDTTYEHKKLSSQVWAYADPDSLSYLDRVGAVSIGDNPALTDYLSSLEGLEYNMGFISTPLHNPSTNPMVQQFANQLLYTVALSHLAPQDVYGDVVMQFAENVVPSPRSSYQPQLAAIAPSDAALYIEFSDLLGTFAIGKDQFVSLAPIIFGQYNAAFGALLNSEQYGTLYDVLSDNMALVVVPAENTFGVSAHLYMGHADAFDLMSDMQAFWKLLAGGVIGSDTLTEQASAEGFAYGIEGIPVFGDGPLLSLNKSVDATVISLLGLTPTSDSGVQGLSYDDSTVISFKVNASQLEDKIANNPLTPYAQGVGPIEGSTDYLGGKTIIGDVQLHTDKDQIHVAFTVSE